MKDTIEDIEKAALNAAIQNGYIDDSVRDIFVKGFIVASQQLLFDKPAIDSVLEKWEANLKENAEQQLPVDKDATKDLLTDIIDWDKGSGGYMLLETILKKRYKITKR